MPLLLCLLTLSGCRLSSDERDPRGEDRAVLDSIVRSATNLDTLHTRLSEFTAEGNLPGMMLAEKELGKRYRNQTLYSEAMRHHRQNLRLAEELKDTIEIIQALNNIGTNFRRMGILDEASTYHYRALSLCSQYGDRTSYTARKNRVVSLNGIGNVHLTLDNRETADSVFRAALAGEKELGSDLGQAINYANIGALFEADGAVDSAMVYYCKSMEHNVAAKSTLGISLCHTYVGRIHEKNGEWDKALREYRQAYRLMEDSPDRWHWLESCMALARIYTAKDDLANADKYLALAETTARDINSWEHLSQIYLLDYRRYEKRGDCRKALDAYVKSRAYSDSVWNEKNASHLQNLRVNYEKERSSHELALIRNNHEMERKARTIYIRFILLALLLTLTAAGFLYYFLLMKSRNQRIMRHMEKVRSNFFTNVTHEFRTPLTVILGLSQQMKSQDTDAETRRKYLDNIICQGNGLLQLVNRLLDISKVQSAIGEPQWYRGNAVAYISMIVENYQYYARQKGIDLRYAPAENQVMMDFVPEYLHKIIENLLSNAIKYTDKGGKVYLTTLRQADRLTLKVADSGKGIAPEDLPHIFEEFYQGGNHSLTMGTGIGLSLVNLMVKSMDGEITVRSAKGEGSVFCVSLPLKHGDTVWKEWIPEPVHTEIPFPCEVKKDAPDMPDGEDTDDDAQPSILIVEDNFDVSFYIGELLKKDYRLFYASNGAEALEKAKDFMPDLIVTDMMMPEMDGYGLCHAVRRSDILNHIPIVVITAKCEEADRVRMLEAGVDAYLQKPFNADELQVRVGKLLEQRRILREKFGRAIEEGNGQEVDLSPVDRNFLERLTNIIYAGLSDSSLNSLTVSDRMCMSKSQLNRKIRTITGYNTTAYILQIRMEKAKRLLASTELTIGDIAMQCGFEDAGYFGRVFKQVFDITPSQYRKQPNNHK